MTKSTYNFKMSAIFYGAFLLLYLVKEYKLRNYLNKKDISKKKEIKILKGKPDIKGIKE